MSDAAGSVLFIGNATILIRYNGFVLLTDPNFLHRGQRAYLGHGLTTKRLTDPAIGVGDLPSLDAVVLSHMHGDHWDRVARKGLDKGTPIVTTPHAARRLERQRFGRAVGLPVWGTHELRKPSGSVTVTALPGRHGPGAAQRLLPPVMGSMLDFRDGDGRLTLRMYVSGDTIMDPSLRAIPNRFPDIDVGVVHLGGTRLLGLLTVTMDARQGTRWVELADPRLVMPVHYDDYAAFKSPLADFRREIEATRYGPRVRYVARGETVTLPSRSASEHAG